MITDALQAALKDAGAQYTLARCGHLKFMQVLRVEGYIGHLT